MRLTLDGAGGISEVSRGSHGGRQDGVDDLGWECVESELDALCCGVKAARLLRSFDALVPGEGASSSVGPAPLPYHVSALQHSFIRSTLRHEHLRFLSGQVPVRLAAAFG